MTDHRQDDIRLNLPSSRRHAPLTCGQRYIWRVITELRAVETLNVPVVVTVELVRNLDEVKSILTKFVARYEAVRTLFPIGPNGEPQQILQASGLIPLTIVDGGNDVAGAAKDLERHLEQTHFDLARDLPIRCGAITSNGRVEIVITVFSHMVADGWSTAVIHDYLNRALNGDGDLEPPDPVWSPFDQAEWEGSSEGRHVLSSSLQYWKTALAQFPRALFYRKLPEPQSLRWYSAELHSPALGKALHLIAERNGVSTATALFTCLAMVLGKLVGTKSFCAVTLYCNRTSAQVEQAVGSFPQGTPVIVDLKETDFSAILVDTHFNLMDAYPNAQVWVPSIEAILAEIGARAGTWIELDTSFNISHDATLETTQKELNGGAETFIADSANRGRIAERQFRPYDLHTFSIKSYRPSEIFMLADTTYVSVKTLEHLLLSVEELATTMAIDPSANAWQCLADAGIDGRLGSSDWRRVGGSWINLSAVRSYFLIDGQIREFAVFPSPDAQTLIAHYVLSDACADINDFLQSPHQDLLLDRSTMIPAEFIQNEIVPDDIADEASWKKLSVVRRSKRAGVREAPNCWREKSVSLNCV